MFIEVAIVGVTVMAAGGPIGAFLIWWRNRKSRKAQLTENDEKVESKATEELKNTEAGLESPMLRAESTQSDDFEQETAESVASGDFVRKHGAFKDLVNQAQRRKRLARQTLTTTYQRLSKGKVKVQKFDAYEDYILIENTSNNLIESLSNWHVKRTIEDNADDVIEYQFPDEFKLPPTFSVKIFANGKDPGNAVEHTIHLVADQVATWRSGVTSQTQLFNAELKLQAALVQKVSVTKELLPEGSIDSMSITSMPSTPVMPVANGNIFS